MNSALQHQVGGEHYKNLAIQPAEYTTRNGIGHMAGDAIAYITRYKSKHGREDLEKAIHSIQILISQEYGDPAPGHPELALNAGEAMDAFNAATSPPVKPDDVPDLEPGWTFAGFGRLSGVSDLTLDHTMDVGALEDSEWNYGGWGGDGTYLYAVRTGSEIHRAQTWFDESQLAEPPPNLGEARSNLEAIPEHLPKPPEPLAGLSDEDLSTELWHTFRMTDDWLAVAKRARALVTGKGEG